MFFTLSSIHFFLSHLNFPIFSLLTNEREGKRERKKRREKKHWKKDNEKSQPTTALYFFFYLGKDRERQINTLEREKRKRW